MRATFDFEAYDWVKPLCCGLYWQDSTSDMEDTLERFVFMHEDEKHNSGFNAPYDGKNLLETVLHEMAYKSLSYHIEEWWAHNGGKYDSLLLLQEGLKHNYRMIGIPAAGRLIRLDIYVPMRTKEVRVRLLDSYAVVQAKLGDALKSFGCEQQKKFQADDYKQDMRQMPIEALREGCYADCKGLYQMLDTVEKQIVGWGGQLKSTFSSSAMSVVKAHLAGNGVKFPSHEGNQDANEIGRKAFYGGRVEVFHHLPQWVRMGQQLQVFDVNSSYPASMRESLPWELYGKLRNADSDFLDDEDFEAVLFARVNVPHDMYIPPLPYRPVEGGVFFPTGEWSAWFPANELRYARSLGVDVNVLEGLVYTKAEPFKKFVDDLYEFKRRSTGAARMFAKLSLNGCYGKFGMKPEREVLRIFESEEDGLGYAMATGARKMDSWRVLACKTFRWAPTTHYALASYITAGARIRLHRSLLASKRPTYTDTDSVHCMAYSGVSSDAVGEMKFEGMYSHAQYYAPKLYALTQLKTEKISDAEDAMLYAAGMQASRSPFTKIVEETHYVSKGFPVEAEAFKRIIKGMEVKTGRMQLAKSQLRKGGMAAYIEQHKRWNGRSMKRFAFQTGQTRPWTVEELCSGAHLTMKSPLYKPEREK